MTTDDDSTVNTSTAAQATGAVEGSRGAARLLEVAAHNADELIADARAEAQQITTSARLEADRVLAAAQAEADQVRAEIEQNRAQHATEIARLQQVENEYRERVRAHLTGLLAQIEAPPS